MSESRAWQKLKAALSDPGVLPMKRCDVKGEFGWPDVCFQDPLTPGRAGWLELKYLDTGAAKARGKKIGLRPDQALWLSQWVRHGGIAGVLVYQGDTKRWGFLRAEDTSAWRVLACAPEGYRMLQWLDRLETLPEVLCGAAPPRYVRVVPPSS